MFKGDVPLTRENYLRMNYPLGLEEPWTAEHEAELPGPFQTDDQSKWPKPGDW